MIRSTNLTIPCGRWNRQLLRVLNAAPQILHLGPFLGRGFLMECGLLMTPWSMRSSRRTEDRSQR